MAESITITRGLAELKMLSKRIDKQAKAVVFTDLYQKRSGRMLKSGLDGPEFEKKVKADWKSLSDLLERRQKIKSSIIKSNAKTRIDICGKKTSVAEAIEMKTSIDMKRNILERMRHELAGRKNEIDNQRVTLEDAAEKMLQANYGVEKKSSSDDYDKIGKPLIEANEFNLKDPVNIEKQIDDLDKYIDEFDKEIDFVLTESN